MVSLEMAEALHDIIDSNSFTYFQLFVDSKDENINFISFSTLNQDLFIDFCCDEVLFKDFVSFEFLMRDENKTLVLKVVV